MEDSYDIYKNNLIKALGKISSTEIERLTQSIVDTIGNNKIFICGNGGSASTAEHMSCDLSKSVYKLCDSSKINDKLQVISLNSNISQITAIANDIDYKSIFSEQLLNFAKPNDLLIVITASGNSPNILDVVEVANSLKMKTFGLLGFGGGKAKDLVSHSICVDSYDYGVVEDCHLVINHMITDYLKMYFQSRYQK